MAEYYPLLAKAVASLPNSTLDSRKVVYERARKALIGQLRMLHPPVPEEDIARESAALDAAIARVEAELAAASNPAAPPEPVAALAGSEAVALAEPAARFPMRSGALGPSAGKPFPPLRTKAAAPRAEAGAGAEAPASRQPAVVEAVGDAAPAVIPSDPVPVGVPVPSATALSAREPAAREPAISAPVAVLAPVGREAAEAERRSRPRPDQQRPIAPQPPTPKRARRPLWIIPAGVGLVVLAVAVTAYKLRDRPEALHPRASEQAQAPTDAGKSVDRVGAPATSGSAEPTRTAADDTPAAPQATAAAANPAAPIAGRAALLVEAPEEHDKFKTYIGAVVWRLDNVSDGRNQSVGLGVRADIDLPDDKMKATVLFQKNVDSSLPASHTIKIRFSVQPGSPSGGIKEINVPQMRREDSSAGEPLDGVTVTIVENSFLVGLSPGTAEATNLEMLRSREWIDIPIRLVNGKIAKLTFEKTAAGQRNLQEAIAAWAKS